MSTVATDLDSAVADTVKIVTFFSKQRVLPQVGMKRSLVFYGGRPPCRSKTEWVIH
jgi:hypothetical protein